MEQSVNSKLTRGSWVPAPWRVAGEVAITEGWVKRGMPNPDGFPSKESYAGTHHLRTVPDSSLPRFANWVALRCSLGSLPCDLDLESAALIAQRDFR
jgi:hypothetical protein